MWLTQGHISFCKDFAVSTFSTRRSTCYYRYLLMHTIVGWDHISPAFHLIPCCPDDGREREPMVVWLAWIGWPDVCSLVVLLARVRLPADDGIPGCFLTCS